MTEAMDVSHITNKGNYLKKGDVDDPITFTIADVEFVTFKDEDDDKVQLTLDDGRKWTLNVTNTKVLQRHYGDDAREWINRRVTATYDETVSFGNQMVGGLKASVPKTKPAAAGQSDSPASF